MKPTFFFRYILYIGIGIVTVGCADNGKGLHNGDLIFESTGNSAASLAIDAATAHADEESFSHVGIIEVGNDGVYVIEATMNGGVQRNSLDRFLKKVPLDKEGKPAVTIMRLCERFDASEFIENAKRHIGEPYDYYFMPGNGRMYCSELVYESYLTSTGNHIFTAHPMNFKAADGSMPEYWTNLFKTLGDTIPQGVLGTNPNDMAREKSLMKVSDNIWELYAPETSAK